ncbi:hypothetical protein B484DRAFT_423912, partial [Ochromonadaceae sp. CCMP2298]
MQVCTSCDTSLAVGLRLHFCPYCGTPQLTQKLIAGASTRDFDPLNPSFKPWRDKSLLPKRVYKESKSKPPWCPPMRQSGKRAAKPRVVAVRAEEAAPEVEVEEEVVEAVVEVEEEVFVPAKVLEFYTEVVHPVACYDASWMPIGRYLVYYILYTMDYTPILAFTFTLTLTFTLTKTHSPLPITHYPLPITHYPLP